MASTPDSDPRPASTERPENPNNHNRPDRPENPDRPITPVTALLLPGYSPNLSWLARAIHADRVILDDLHPFSRKSKVHRTKIRTPDGHQWLTIPFVREDRRKPINQVRIDDLRPWTGHHLQALEYNYRNSPYFDFYEPEIRADFDTASRCGFLMDAVRHLMQRQWTYLEFPEFPLWSSDLVHGMDAGTDPSPGTNLYDLVADDRTVVWQEPDSRHYQRPHPAAVQNDTAAPVFHSPGYRQHFPGFVPDCGLLDLLFEYGPDAWQVLDGLTLKSKT